MKPSWCPEIGTCRNSCHLVPLLSSPGKPRLYSLFMPRAGKIQGHLINDSVPSTCQVPCIFTVFATLPQGKERLLCLTLEQRLCAQEPWRRKGLSMAQRSEARLWKEASLSGSVVGVFEMEGTVSRSSGAKITLYWIQRWVCLSEVVTREKRTDLRYHQSRIFKEKKDFVWLDLKLEIILINYRRKKPIGRSLWNSRQG